MKWPSTPPRGSISQQRDTILSSGHNLQIDKSLVRGGGGQACRLHTAAIQYFMPVNFPWRRESVLTKLVANGCRTVSGMCMQLVIHAVAGVQEHGLV
jgi:hypothetical protein